MDNLKHFEIELKFPLLNHLELIEKLKSIAKLEKSEDFQKDIYYTPAHRNFLSKKPVSEWLRLREFKKGFSLNYKKWHNEDGNKTISCDEFETNIENIEALNLSSRVSANWGLVFGAFLEFGCRCLELPISPTLPRSAPR